MRNFPSAKRGGMAYELIRECVRDIDGVARFLRSRGYRELYLIGHSTGANKIAVYDHIKRRNPFRKYVLLAGADDTGMFYRDLGPARFRRTLERARTKRDDELVPPSITPMMLSWRSLYDMINPDGDYNIFPFLELLRGVRLSRRARFRTSGGGGRVVRPASGDPPSRSVCHRDARPVPVFRRGRAAGLDLWPEPLDPQ